MLIRIKRLSRMLLFIPVFVAGVSLISLAQQNTVNLKEVDIINAVETGSGNTYALIIGISKYKYLPHLAYADDDAEAFRDFLLETKTVTDSNHIFYLTDSTATKTDIFKACNSILTKVNANNNDRVFIYFAGHADTESETGQTYLLAYGCEEKEYFVTDAIYLPQFEPVVGAIAKKAKVFLIIDASRSGTLAGGNTGSLLAMSSLNKGFSDVTKILSCEPGQLSMEKNFPDGGHGVFTYFLLEALHGLGVSDSTQFITLKNVKEYIIERVFESSQEQQSPVVIGNSSEIICKVNPEIRKAVIERKKKSMPVPANR